MPENRNAIPRKSKYGTFQQGKYYALLIGVSAYKFQESLEYPVKDARKLEGILLKTYAFTKKNITVLENPTRTNILDTLDGFEQILEPEDSLLIFYAGHGHWEAKNNRGYWLPKDARKRAKAAWISNATLQDYLMAFACQHVLVISDSCFSGALLMNRSAIKDAEKEIQVLYSAKSRKAITSGVKEVVPDRSVFFKELSQFLRKNKRSFLSASELFAGIRNNIIAESPNHQKPQFGAIAETGDEGGDFIFIKKGNQQTLSTHKPNPFDALLADPRIKDRLFALRQQLDRDIPAKSLTNKLLVATWNIRQFGGNKYGGRTEEALGYIATIIERFDIVAIQEIYGDFQILDRLQVYLGEHWEYIFSDTSIGPDGGGYRVGYFYDKRKVLTGGMTNDLILPSKRTRNEAGQFVYTPAVQLLRPPFNCGFKVENKRFILCNMHLVFGSSKRKKERIRELQSILDFWKWRTNLKHSWSKNVILLGNFQTEKLSNLELQMVKDEESIFQLGEHLLVPTNATKTRYYNQMAFHLDENAIAVSEKGGAFDFFESVFRPNDETDYVSMMGDNYLLDVKGSPKTDSLKRVFYTAQWRTLQMSDNLPLWVELEI